MFRIGEFSKLTQVSIRMLRYYDKMGLLKPAQIDPWTGYRLYSAEQIPALNKIVFLRDSGFNVGEIAEAISNWDRDHIIGHLDSKYTEIEKTILTEQEKLRKIRLAKAELTQNRSEMHYQVTMKSIPSYQVLSYRKIIPDYYAEGIMWNKMVQFADRHSITLYNDTFSIYHDMEYKEKDVDVELCALVEKTGKDMEGFTFRHTEPVPHMACTMVYGGFEHIAGAYLSLAKWLQKNAHYKMTGKSRQIVHRGPWNEENPEKYLVEVQIAL